MPFTLDDVARLAVECRNWGRWGDDDEIGTLNFVDGEAVRGGRDAIRSGDVFSLAIDFGPSGPQTSEGSALMRRFNPMHWMLRNGCDLAAAGTTFGHADDVVQMCIHGATHWDGLGHNFHDGRMWNGYDMRLVGSAGVRRNAITAVRDRLAGRGVMVDMARHHGIDTLAPGDAIHAADLDACLDAEGVTLRPGDFLLIRTGQLGQCLLHGWGAYAGGDAPGLSLDTVPWLRRHSVAAVATDTWGAEVRPNEVSGMSQPWHKLVIPNLGLTVGEMFALDRLATACAEDRRYTFFLSAPPLPIEGGTGSPVNPLAIR